MRLLQEYSPMSNSGMTFRVPAGNYKGFLFRLKGTGVDAAHYLSPNGALGMIQLFDRQIPRVNASWRMLMNANMKWFGAPTQIWTAGATASFLSVFLPASPDFTNMPNAFFAERDGDLVIQFNNGTDMVIANSTDANTNLAIYAVPTNFHQVFNPMIVEMNDHIGAAVSAYQLQNVNCPNITDIFLYPNGGEVAVSGAVESANMTRALIDLGNGQIIEGDQYALWSLANLFDNIELTEVLTVPDATTNVPKIIHIVPAETRDWTKVGNSQVRIQVTASAEVYIQSLYFGGEFAGDRAFSSREVARAKVQQQFEAWDTVSKQHYTLAIGAKNGANHVEAVKVASALTKTGIAKA